MRRSAALALALAVAACSKKPELPPPADTGSAQAAKSLAAIVASGAAVEGDVQVRRAGQAE